MKLRHLIALISVSGLALTACDEGTVELSTTSSVLTETTETAAPTATTTTSQAPEQSTVTTLVGETVSSYEVVVRISGDNGETLHIVIPPGAYTEVDLENFIGDLKEADPELWGAEVFDDADAIQAFAIPEEQRTSEQQALLDEHHFASLVNGDTLAYRGPFADFGEFVIGS